MQVKVEIGGVRLDKAVADLKPLTRSHANEKIKNGQILVNGQVKKAKYGGASKCGAYERNTGQCADVPYQGFVRYQWCFAPWNCPSD